MLWSFVNNIDTKRKVVLLLIFSFVCILAGWSQSNIRLNHYWENPYTVTPAYISNQYNWEFSTAARHQWVGFEGAPKSMFFIASTYVDKWNTQLGLKAFHDKIGYTNTTDVSLSYGYAVVLSQNWRLHFGIAAGYQNFSFDDGKRIMENENDPAINNNFSNEDYFNADLGAELAGKTWRIGIAAQNILTSVNYFDNKLYINNNTQQTYNSYLQNKTNFAYAAYRGYSGDEFDFSAGITGISYGKNMNQLELFGSVYYKSSVEYNKEKIDRLRLGFFYRTSGEAGAIFSVYLHDKNNKYYSISYIYDYNFSSIGLYATGTHEIMLTFRLPKYECYPCRWHTSYF